MGSTAQKGIEAVGNVLRIIGMLIVTVLVVHIVLSLLGANTANYIAQTIQQLADTFNLVGDLFVYEDPRIGLALNYGISALIWYIITQVVVRLIRRIP